MLNEIGIMQKERKYDLSERLIEFSVSVIRLSDKVFKTSAGVYLSGQLVRSEQLLLCFMVKLRAPNLEMILFIK